jgi:hypothetical protein
LVRPIDRVTDLNTSIRNQQIYYVYGQRKSGDVDKSYQMGFGSGTYPRNPHHRATSCDDKGALFCAI